MGHDKAPSIEIACYIAADKGTMPTLQEIACEKSGVNMNDAFAIDQGVSLYDKLGHDVIVKISTEFYNRVYADDQDWFRNIFATSTKEQAIQNQYEFFIQRFGGPDLYSQRKGHPALIARHAPFSHGMSDKAAERWIAHMTAAINATPEVDEDSKRRLLNFLRHTAYFITSGMELMKKRQEEGQL